MTYTPNFNDPRVRRRCETAIDFVDRYIRNQIKPIAQSQIHLHFGRSNDNLGRYLKEQLLICTNHFYDVEAHIYKKYRRNNDGAAELKQNLKRASKPAAVRTPITELAEDLTDQLISGEFEYKEQADRWFNPIQTMARSDRNQHLLKTGYKYDYDIESAAPTLLYQYAQKEAINRDLGSKSLLILPHIEAYLKEKTLIRERIAKNCGCDVISVKKAITALFQGAYLSNNTQTALFYDLGSNHSLIHRLKADPVLQSLREDIKLMWKEISVNLKDRKLKLLTGGRDISEITDREKQKEIKRKSRLNGRDKAELYRKLEREVMSVIWDELQREQIHHLRIHDGWASKQVCDIEEITRKVLVRTGYHIRVIGSIISSNNNNK